MFLLLRPDIFPKRLGVTGFESSGQNGLQKVSFCPLKIRLVERGHISSLATTVFGGGGLGCSMPSHQMLETCGVNVFKRKLDNFLSQVPDD